MSYKNKKIIAAIAIVAGQLSHLKFYCENVRDVSSTLVASTTSTCTSTLTRINVFVRVRIHYSQVRTQYLRVQV